MVKFIMQKKCINCTYFNFIFKHISGHKSATIKEIQTRLVTFGFPVNRGVACTSPGVPAVATRLRGARTWPVSVPLGYHASIMMFSQKKCGGLNFGYGPPSSFPPQGGENREGFSANPRHSALLPGFGVGKR